MRPLHVIALFLVLAAGIGTALYWSSHAHNPGFSASSSSIRTTASAGSTSPSNQVSLLIYIPPVVQPAISSAVNAYMQQHPNVKVEIIAGATGTLINRISVTGEGDLLITADHEYMLNASRSNLVYNQTVKVLSFAILALLVPKGNPANVTGLSDLVTKDVKIGIANPSVAPYGKLAVQLLEKNNIYDQVKDKLVVFGDVGQVARELTLGMIDAALLPHVIYYAFKNDTQIIWLNATQLPKQSCQMIAVLTTTKHYQEAYDLEKFIIDYMRSSPEAHELGYITDLADIPKYTPYNATDLSFVSECLVG